MTFTMPYRQHNFLGNYAAQDDCEAFLSSVGWNISDGMFYFDTNTKSFVFRINSKWQITKPSQCFYLFDDFLGDNKSDLWQFTYSGGGSSAFIMDGVNGILRCEFSNNNGSVKVGWSKLRWMGGIGFLGLKIRLKFNDLIDTAFEVEIDKLDNNAVTQTYTLSRFGTDNWQFDLIRTLFDTDLIVTNTAPTTDWTDIVIHEYSDHIDFWINDDKYTSNKSTLGDRGLQFSLEGYADFSQGSFEIDFIELLAV